MKNKMKVLIMLTLIMVMGCSAVFAASTHINVSINSKVPLHGDTLIVSVDGKHLCTFSESDLKSDNINYSADSHINIGNYPYDIKIEYIKGDYVKTFNFTSDQKYDVVLKYYFDGENITDKN